MARGPASHLQFTKQGKLLLPHGEDLSANLELAAQGTKPKFSMQSSMRKTLRFAHKI